jgi:histidinol-phosphatase (PHP family)
MSLESAYLRSKELGISGLAITDHIDIKCPGENSKFIFDPLKRRDEIEKLNISSDFLLLDGVEVGMLLNNLEELDQFVNNYKFDVVIGSVHFIDGLDPYEGSYYAGIDEITAYSRYLELIFNLINKFSYFDILGHYDYIARYSPYLNKTIRYKSYSDHFDAIFKYLIENGKSIEINTNSFRRRGDSAPTLDLDVILRYREMGGELISLSSDAHTSSRIAESFDKYYMVLKQCGFKYITHYKNRVANPIKIV